MKCKLCKEDIPRYKRVDSKYCDSYCRDLGYRIRKGMFTYAEALIYLHKHRKRLGILGGKQI